MDDGDQAAEGGTPPEGLPAEARRLADRLEYLFSHVQPLRRRHTLQEVVDGIRDDGGAGDTTLSVGRLSMLVNGKVPNPTIGTLRSLARFFGVPIAYFVDDDVAAQTMAQLALLNAIRANDVQAVALRAAAVATSSAHGIDMVRTLVERARGVADGTHGAPDRTPGGTAGADRPE
ncbi:helix-turn-helix transcriptional regulator [Streptomyces xanthophaeus]|uniref:helix-turn-helix transcriptional regulator n=1 Tax=Streptomyces xanthophaeus TaxID=67385 RepID=UPI0034341A6C